ncbi:FAD binding domain-containing protein [Hirsutella rhossiliensis]|uniref:FAD binding domain-containing protein n=1 Tax=Hirsutella rhossiliensis TaxID=111463 RepID=A0A9P8MTR0_9HYPO|nr:FAD binding domain-containing protein [Hirsutella rhossiliensis]KAH0961978.1 FAD binding domain-containing protein [Hirsutella rhossiliensis]
MPAPIAIVGAGPCGLTFARLLQGAGIEYVVFERDASPEPPERYQGGTLDVHGHTGQAALRRAGLHAEFERLARRDATTMTIQDARGNHRATFGEGRDAPEIDRLQLRQMLLDSLPAHRIRWGKVLRSAERDGRMKQSDPAGPVLRFADGSVETGFRLVVGADGAWSKLRQMITSAKPHYSGTMFVEGWLTQNNSQYQAARDMVGSGNSMAMSAERSLCVQQMSDGSYRVYMGLKAPETLTGPGGDADLADMDKARAAMLGFYADWAPHLRAFVDAAEGPWRSWLLYHLDPDLFLPEAPGWTRAPGIVLLGDAAHVAIPNGEGVNQALYDALVLFECILSELGKTDGCYNQDEDAAALERAVVAYEMDMRPRARLHIQDGLDLDHMIYNDEGAQRMVHALTVATEQSGAELS